MAGAQHALLLEVQEDLVDELIGQRRLEKPAV
jgi:hypothetical protein